LDLIFDVTVIDNSAYLKNGFLNNIFTIQVQTAPMPYVANASGSWTTEGTWEYGNVWDIENLPNKDWAIVQVTNNSKVTTTASHTHLGTLVDSGSELSIENDQLLTTTSYLKLDGHLDLVGESQLIQTTGSTFESASTGYLERDQQGKSNIYRYNFWSSPVYPTVDGVNNSDYSIAEILRSGITAATPQNITFATSGYNGSTAGNNVTLADYWMFKFVNQPDIYANWMNGHVRSTGNISPGQGYTMKGAGASVVQNYVFTGKPNNGPISLPIGANNVYFVGNPYASALDAHTFIDNNINSVQNGDVINSGTSTGTLYFWEHWGGGSHYLAQYEGGYATMNKLGYTTAVSDADVSSNGSGVVIPKRYIPVGQGFFVQGDANGGNIVFNNSQREFQKESGGSSIFFKSSEESIITESIVGNSIDRVYFKFTTPEGPGRQLLLGVKDGLTVASEYGYDGKRLNEQHTDCGWKIEEAPYVIQGIGEIYDDLELPLQIKVGVDGVCKFEVGDLSDLDPSIEVYLLDKELDRRVRLESGIPTEFNLVSGEYNDRFYVVFKTAKVLAVEDNTVTSDDLVVFYNAATQSIDISNPSEFSAKNISLYNVAGQQVVKVTNEYINTKLITIPVSVASGAYLVTFDYNNGQQITKKLIIK